MKTKEVKRVIRTSKYASFYTCDSFRGKMEDNVAISTTAIVNPRCIERIMAAIAAGDDKCVCIHCYALRGFMAACGFDNMKDFVNFLIECKTTEDPRNAQQLIDLILTINPNNASTAGQLRNMINNAIALSSRVLSDEEIPLMMKAGRVDEWVRGESHGDLINAIHGVNLLKTAALNPETLFVLWTKNLDILASAVSLFGYKPDNFKVVYSSDHVDVIAPVSCEYRHIVDKIFTVWSSAEKAAAADMVLHCCNGDKKHDREQRCKKCRVCYESNIVYVNEALR